MLNHISMNVNYYCFKITLKMTKRQVLTKETRTFFFLAGFFPPVFFAPFRSCYFPESATVCAIFFYISLIVSSKIKLILHCYYHSKYIPNYMKALCIYFYVGGEGKFLGTL